MLLFVATKTSATPSPLTGRALHYNHFSVFAKAGKAQVLLHQLSGVTDVWFQFKTDSLIVTDDSGRRGCPTVPVKMPNGVASVMACNKTTRTHQIYQYYPNGRLRCIFEADGYWWIVVFYDKPQGLKINNFKEKMRVITNLPRL